MTSREPEGEVGAPAAVTLVTVPCGNLETCPQGQGMGTFTFVPVQLKFCRQANIPDAGIGLIDSEEIRAISPIIEKKTPFRCLIAASLWNAKSLPFSFLTIVDCNPLLGFKIQFIEYSRK